MAGSYTRVVDGHISKLLILRAARVLARDNPCAVDIIEHFTIRGALGWDDTAAYCPSVQNDGAGATLSQAASEFRAIQPQIVAESIKQRRRGTDVNGAHFPFTLSESCMRMHSYT